jgi:hypothetical protein
VSRTSSQIPLRGSTGIWQAGTAKLSNRNRGLFRAYISPDLVNITRPPKKVVQPGYGISLRQNGRACLVALRFIWGGTLIRYWEPKIRWESKKCLKMHSSERGWSTRFLSINQHQLLLPSPQECLNDLGGVPRAEEAPPSHPSPVSAFPFAQSDCQFFLSCNNLSLRNVSHAVDVRRTLRQSFAQILRSERSPYLRGNLCCFRPRTLGQAFGLGDQPSRFRIFS